MSSSSSTDRVSSSPLDRRVFTYTSCYCEENVYNLIKSLVLLNFAAPDATDLYVVFISNSGKQIPMWCQRSSKQEDGLCIWDYHVICIQKILDTDAEALVWDLDSTLSFPVSFTEYLKKALHFSMVVNPHFQRLFRIIAAPVFVKHFASDRRHMKDGKGGWLAIPPECNCIAAEDGTMHNLDVYVEFPQHAQPFEWVMLDQMHQQFGLVVSENGLKALFTTERFLR